MSKVILDDDLRAKLNGLNEVVPVCEPDGRSVGVFMPEETYQAYLAMWAKAEFATPEAVRDREAALRDYRAGQGMTTEQAITYLKGLRGESSRP
jgi:hypothetical protein